MQSVRLAVSLNTASTKISRVCESFRAVLKVLEASRELRFLKVQVREVFHSAVRHHFVNEQLGFLREEVVERGLREGKMAREIEIDFAWRALEFFENGFRVVREGEPCCSRHALYWSGGGRVERG